VQNFVEQSAAVHVLSWSQREKNPTKAIATADSNTWALFVLGIFNSECQNCSSTIQISGVFQFIWHFIEIWHYISVVEKGVNFLAHPV